MLPIYRLMDFGQSERSTKMANRCDHVFLMLYRLQSKIAEESPNELNWRELNSGAIFWAMENSLPHIAEFLLEKGAYVDAVNKYGWTALILASVEGHSDYVQLLLEHGAEVNAQARNGKTALTYASEEGHSDIVQLLLENGADVNARATDSGLTALMLASLKTHADVVKLLLKHDANANAEDYDGWAALMYAS